MLNTSTHIGDFIVSEEAAGQLRAPFELLRRTAGSRPSQHVDDTGPHQGLLTNDLSLSEETREEFVHVVQFQ